MWVETELVGPDLHVWGWNLKRHSVIGNILEELRAFFAVVLFASTTPLSRQFASEIQRDRTSFSVANSKQEF
jgi:hypothetical protein